MTKWKNSPQKKFQEEVIAKQFIKTDINNIIEQQFTVTIVRSIARLKTCIEELDTHCCRDEGTKK